MERRRFGSTGREVAVKTIRESSDPAAFELFLKACAQLANLDSHNDSHNDSNIVDIYDAGELIQRAMAKRSSDRFSTAKEFAEALFE